MIAATFVIGFIAGMLALLAFAAKYVDRKAEKPKAAAPKGVAAVGVDISGNGIYRNSLGGELQIFRMDQDGQA
jgi:hypothetical protein